MLPGTPGKCPNGRNTYNPTVRPWYVAASSGPKDVILVIDTSGSMRERGRMVSKFNYMFALESHHMNIYQFSTIIMEITIF